MRRRFPGSLAAITCAMAALLAAAGQDSPQPRRNVVIFVADGLRHGSVNAQDTPALWTIRTEGVHFENSHSLFPTFTMANASAIATGRGLGETGVFANTIWPGFVTYDTGNFGLLPETPVPFIENDRVVADLGDHFDGNLLGTETFLGAARRHGYRTATIGKVGPTALQDAAAIAPSSHAFPTTMPGIVLDDVTGAGVGVPWVQDIERGAGAAGLAPAAPTRSNGYGPTSQYNNGFSGDMTAPGTLAANVVQQDWFADVATKVVLPALTKDGTAPFAMVFWSRDPDGTQHNHGDSLGKLDPGVNGESSRRAVRNADRSLQRLLAWFDSHPAIKAATDIVVTSDHGVATISRGPIDSSSRLTTSESARHDYIGPDGTMDTLKGTLPFGFLALDLAYDLQLNLFDPDRRTAGSRLYRRLRQRSADGSTLTTWEHPLLGNGFLSMTAPSQDGADARVIVAANGGSDLIYVPDGSSETVRHVVDRLLTYDYVSGLFVDDKYGDVPGTLPLSAVNLIGSSKVPRPAIVVAFKVFYRARDDFQSAVQISDAVLQQGQGMHGGFGRDSTYNNMAAIGPDFRARSIDTAPVGNTDIAPTLAHLLGFDLTSAVPLGGRVMSEALAGGRPAAVGLVRSKRSTAANGKQTIVFYQEFGGIRYLDKGCFVSPETRDDDACR